MKKLIALFALCMLAATAAFADDVPAGELAALNDLRALATGDVTFTVRDGHIVSVFADNCGLSSLPATLGNLSDRERLELRGNNRTELTDAFSGLDNLKVL
ncbi:MAG: hypothetical protein J6U98_09840, partial [Abditibacteriota bacterium]|nr:hypothetical protein [Abditibacteriota bacterium]